MSIFIHTSSVRGLSTASTSCATMVRSCLTCRHFRGDCWQYTQYLTKENHQRKYVLSFAQLTNLGMRGLKLRSQIRKVRSVEAEASMCSSFARGLPLGNAPSVSLSPFHFFPTACALSTAVSLAVEICLALRLSGSRSSLDGGPSNFGLNATSRTAAVCPMSSRTHSQPSAASAAIAPALPAARATRVSSEQVSFLSNASVSHNRTVRSSPPDSTHRVSADWLMACTGQGCAGRTAARAGLARHLR